MHIQYVVGKQKMAVNNNLERTVPTNHSPLKTGYNRKKQPLFNNTTSNTAVLMNCNDKTVLKNAVQFLASQQYRQSKYVACNLNPFCNGPFDNFK